MNTFVKKYMLRLWKTQPQLNFILKDRQQFENILFRIPEEPEPNDTVGLEGLHITRQVRYSKNPNGTVNIEYANPKRKKDQERSLVKISNDADGWNYFNTQIRPAFSKGTNFDFYYRCHDPSKGGSVFRINRNNAKVVLIYVN